MPSDIRELSVPAPALAALIISRSLNHHFGCQYLAFKARRVKLSVCRFTSFKIIFAKISLRALDNVK